jgi:hypothetical protein
VRKVLFVFGGMMLGWVLASIVGGLLLVSVISDMDLEPSAEGTVLALIALAGIVAGGVAGSRLANR